MIRSQYVYNLTVLLRSLPAALTPAEQLSLRAATPQEVLDMADSTHALTPVVRSNQSEEVPPQPQTLLSRATAWLILSLFFIVQFLLPYVRKFLKHAARLEHDHQITRRALTTSITVGSDVSKRCGQAMRRLNDGVAGEVLSNATVYCAESIAVGIQQGLAEAKRSRRMASKRREDGISR